MHVLALQTMEGLQSALTASQHKAEGMQRQLENHIQQLQVDVTHRGLHEAPKMDAAQRGREWMQEELTVAKKKAQADAELEKRGAQWQAMAWQWQWQWRAEGISTCMSPDLFKKLTDLTKLK
eukprot:scaffold98456_cov22-Tisochrysis_lutea.AAC.3